jgi:hypothetical protein
MIRSALSLGVESIDLYVVHPSAGHVKGLAARLTLIRVELYDYQIA